MPSALLFRMRYLAAILFFIGTPAFALDVYVQTWREKTPLRGTFIANWDEADDLAYVWPIYPGERIVVQIRDLAKKPPMVLWNQKKCEERDVKGTSPELVASKTVQQDTISIDYSELACLNRYTRLEIGKSKRIFRFLKQK